MSARPMFLRGHNGRLRLVQSQGMHFVSTTAEVDTFRFPRSTAEAFKGASYGAAIEKPARDTSGAIVFWACVVFGACVSAMAFAGWLK